MITWGLVGVSGARLPYPARISVCNLQHGTSRTPAGNYVTSVIIPIASCFGAPINFPLRRRRKYAVSPILLPGKRHHTTRNFVTSSVWRWRLVVMDIHAVLGSSSISRYNAGAPTDLFHIVWARYWCGPSLVSTHWPCHDPVPPVEPLLLIK